MKKYFKNNRIKIDENSINKYSTIKIGVKIIGVKLTKTTQNYNQQNMQV